jgi:hypothetical protein
MIRPMQNAASWFELHPDSDTLSGCFHDGDLPPRSFAGWLELVTLIEEAQGRRNAVAAADQPNPRDLAPPY